MEKLSRKDRTADLMSPLWQTSSAGLTPTNVRLSGTKYSVIDSVTAICRFGDTDSLAVIFNFLRQCFCRFLHVCEYLVDIVTALTKATSTKNWLGAQILSRGSGICLQFQPVGWPPGHRRPRMTGHDSQYPARRLRRTDRTHRPALCCGSQTPAPR